MHPDEQFPHDEWLDEEEPLPKRLNKSIEYFEKQMLEAKKEFSKWNKLACEAPWLRDSYQMKAEFYSGKAAAYKNVIKELKAL